MKRYQKKSTHFFNALDDDDDAYIVRDARCKKAYIVFTPWNGNVSSRYDKL